MQRRGTRKNPRPRAEQRRTFKSYETCYKCEDSREKVSARTKVSRLDFCREESGIILLAGLWRNPDVALY